MSDKEHFYYRNPQGVIEEHHVREWRDLMDRQTRKPTNAPGEDPGITMGETGGKDPTETYRPDTGYSSSVASYQSEKKGLTA